MKFFSIFLTLFFILNINSNSQIVSDTWENCSKYLVNISRDLSSSNITTTPENWLTYWNQVTPSNAGKWGFIDMSGNIVIKAQYDDVESFSEGGAMVKKRDENYKIFHKIIIQ